MATPSSSAIASASPMVSVGPPPPPLRSPPALVEPEMTIYRLLPIVLIVCATEYCAP
ncbi:MAG: hypothetical protein AW07_00320 [Candidatus Accumulibacter sp. SK-11]|nr:MAG: hypothetical protein AW07_00320 [Candidatus Accumulibacter sp. SK-11]